MADTLEQIFLIGASVGYGFDRYTPSGTTDIRIAAPETRPEGAS
jgi:hypothetical protein